MMGWAGTGKHRAGRGRGTVRDRRRAGRGKARQSEGARHDTIYSAPVCTPIEAYRPGSVDYIARQPVCASLFCPTCGKHSAPFFLDVLTHWSRPRAMLCHLGRACLLPQNPISLATVPFLAWPIRVRFDFASPCRHQFRSMFVFAGLSLSHIHPPLCPPGHSLAIHACATARPNRKA